MLNGDFNGGIPGIIGTCLTMCSLEEVRFRTKKKLIHKLEQGNNDPLERFVKSFCRSAAGIIVKASDVRPPEILMETVNYLLGKVILHETDPFPLVYGFIEDRLRAVRQDMIVQQVSPALTICLLEPMVRFYAFSHYKLVGETNCIEFDSVLNHNCLLECLKSLLKCYDCVGTISTERLEIEAMYVVLNLGNPTALQRSIQLRNAIRAEVLQDAERLSMDWYLKNYYKVTKNISYLPLLLQALTCAVHLPSLRKYALQVMSTAYNSKNLAYPISHLKNLLLYECEEQVVNDVTHYGLETNGTIVRFIKSNFIASQKAVIHRPPSDIESKIKGLLLPEIILYSYLE